MLYGYEVPNHILSECSIHAQIVNGFFSYGRIKLRIKPSLSNNSRITIQPKVGGIRGV